jgi:O-methyltransferase
VSASRRGPWESRVRGFYVRWVRPRIASELSRQRLKLVWFAWGYWRLFRLNLGLRERLRLLRRFLRVDWNVTHAHRPSEISEVCLALGSRRARSGELMVEAGCWRGGSTAKFSLLCEMLGYHLNVYDSFEGVEPLSEEAKRSSYDFSGEYAAAKVLVMDNVERYGALGSCSFIQGWFSDTLARKPLTGPVRLVYIDCDVAKGTSEVLTGVVCQLVPDGRVFSQDFHIEPVRELLVDPRTWQSLGVPVPRVEARCGHLAEIQFNVPFTAGHTGVRNSGA